MSFAKKGLYDDVDLIESDFSLYEFKLRSAHLPKNNLGIRIGHTMYKTMVKKINEGMKYTELNKFFMDDVITKVNAIYPKLDEDITRKIILQGFYKINNYLKLDKEIFLKHKNLAVQMIIYHPFKDYEKNI